MVFPKKGSLLALSAQSEPLSRWVLGAEPPLAAARFLWLSELVWCMSCISAGSSRFSYTCRLHRLMRCFCSASSWLLYLWDLSLPHPVFAVWISLEGASLHVPIFVCRDGPCSLVSSALPGGYFYQAVYIVSAPRGGPILQIDGAALTLRGTRVGFPGLACSNLCDGDWLCSWLASFL